MMSKAGKGLLYTNKGLDQPTYVQSDKGQQTDTSQQHESIDTITPTVNVLKFQTLYSYYFWLKVCFLCSCFLKHLVEWQTV